MKKLIHIFTAIYLVSFISFQLLTLRHERFVTAISETLTLTLLLGFPILISWAVGISIARVELRKSMMVFDVVFLIFTSLVIFITFFAGEKDAQYQLALLFIPFYGMIGLLVSGLFAVAVISFRAANAPIESERH